jgi:hypothetical protein
MSAGLAQAASMSAGASHFTNSSTTGTVVAHPEKAAHSTHMAIVLMHPPI